MADKIAEQAPAQMDKEQFVGLLRTNNLLEEQGGIVTAELADKAFDNSKKSQSDDTIDKDGFLAAIRQIEESLGLSEDLLEEAQKKLSELHEQIQTAKKTILELGDKDALAKTKLAEDRLARTRGIVTMKQAKLRNADGHSFQARKLLYEALADFTLCRDSERKKQAVEEMSQVRSKIATEYAYEREYQACKTELVAAILLCDEHGCEAGRIYPLTIIEELLALSEELRANAMQSLDNGRQMLRRGHIDGVQTALLVSDKLLEDSLRVQGVDLKPDESVQVLLPPTFTRSDFQWTWMQHTRHVKWEDLATDASKHMLQNIELALHESQAEEAYDRLLRYKKFCAAVNHQNTAGKLEDEVLRAVKDIRAEKSLSDVMQKVRQGWMNYQDMKTLLQEAFQVCTDADEFRANYAERLELERLKKEQAEENKYQTPQTQSTAGAAASIQKLRTKFKQVTLMAKISKFSKTVQEVKQAAKIKAEEERYWKDKWTKTVDEVLASMCNAGVNDCLTGKEDQIERARQICEMSEDVETMAYTIHPDSQLGTYVENLQAEIYRIESKAWESQFREQMKLCEESFDSGKIGKARRALTRAKEIYVSNFIRQQMHAQQLEHQNTFSDFLHGDSKSLQSPRHQTGRKQDKFSLNIGGRPPLHPMREASPLGRGGSPMGRGLRAGSPARTDASSAAAGSPARGNSPHRKAAGHSSPMGKVLQSEKGPPSPMRKSKGVDHIRGRLLEESAPAGRRGSLSGVLSPRAPSTGSGSDSPTGRRLGSGSGSMSPAGRRLGSGGMDSPSARRLASSGSGRGSPSSFSRASRAPSDGSQASGKAPDKYLPGEEEDDEQGEDEYEFLEDRVPLPLDWRNMYNQIMAELTMSEAQVTAKWQTLAAKVVVKEGCSDMFALTRLMDELKKKKAEEDRLEAEARANLAQEIEQKLSTADLKAKLEKSVTFGASIFLREVDLELVGHNLLPHCKFRIVPKGRMLHREGEFIDHFWLLLKGHLSMEATVKAKKKAKVEKIAQVGPGRVIGELCALSRRPCFCAATCEEDCEVLQISFSDFDENGSLHDTLDEVKNILRPALTDFLSGGASQLSKVLKLPSEAELMQLLEGVVITGVPRGTEVLGPAGPAGSLFLVHQGEIVVSPEALGDLEDEETESTPFLTETKQIEVKFKTGTYFGENSFISGKAPKEHYTAVAETTMLCISRWSIKPLMTVNPDLLKN